MVGREGADGPDPERGVAQRSGGGFRTGAEGGVGGGGDTRLVSSPVMLVVPPVPLMNSESTKRATSIAMRSDSTWETPRTAERTSSLDTTVRLLMPSRELGSKSTSSTAIAALVMVAPSAHIPDVGAGGQPRNPQRRRGLEDVRTLLQDHAVGDERLNNCRRDILFDDGLSGRSELKSHGEIPIR